MAEDYDIYFNIRLTYYLGSILRDILKKEGTNILQFTVDGPASFAIHVNSDEEQETRCSSYLWRCTFPQTDPEGLFLQVLKS